MIASLKKELADARKNTSSGSAENAKLVSRVSVLQSENEKSQAEFKDIQSKLAESQNEVKSLTVKLEAARKSASVVAEAAKVPGSAVKSRDASSRAQLQGNLDSAKTAALKEELYRDLTGLIINSIKRKDGEDEYSCIQTGRNGSESTSLPHTLFHTVLMLHLSTPFPPQYQQRQHKRQPQDTFGSELRRCRVCIRAVLRRG